MSGSGDNQGGGGANSLDLQLVNEMEPVVRAVVEDRLQRQAELCRCGHCRLDTIALALNTLPPKYVVTHTGEIVTRVTLAHNQWQADVLMAVIRAEEVVKRSPRHGVR